MDMRITGSGYIGPSDYDMIHISGSGRVEGPVRCKSFHCSGSTHCTGMIETMETMEVSGSTHIDGDLRAGNLRVSGSCTINGHCIVQNEIKISGGFLCDRNVKADRLCLSGGVRVANVEAEEIHLNGKVVCSELMNAEKINIEIGGSGSEIGNIGGSIIYVTRKDIGITRLWFKRNKEGKGYLHVRNSIEGDEITLDHVIANVVIGRIVKIGAGCRIKQVQYSESVEIAPGAEVGTQNRV